MRPVRNIIALVVLHVSGAHMLKVSQEAGNLTTENFVDAVYQNVVGIAPLSTEHNFYVGLLEDAIRSKASCALFSCRLLVNQDIDVCLLVIHSILLGKKIQKDQKAGEECRVV